MHMNTATSICLSGLVLTEAQIYRHFVVFPLRGPDAGPAPFLTLDEARLERSLIVTEVSETGSVPDLKVSNRSHRPVLLLDGEELVGARQNRVLKATILLRELADTRIPVSCVDPPTHALHDVFKSRASDLAACNRAFVPGARQTGLLVVVGDEVAGLDILSHADAYAKVHPKLVRSYVIDALAHAPRRPVDLARSAAAAREFLDDVRRCSERVYPSVGYGTGCRYCGRAVVGAALVHNECVVHAAFRRLRSDPDASEAHVRF